MDKYFVEETEGNRFIVNRPNGSWVVLEFDEMKAIESFMKMRRWKEKLREQIDRDNEEGSLDINDEVEEEHFVLLCEEDLANRYEDVGDNYQPCFEDIVFDVAQENGMWRC